MNGEFGRIKQILCMKDMKTSPHKLNDFMKSTHTKSVKRFTFAHLDSNRLEAFHLYSSGFAKVFPKVSHIINISSFQFKRREFERLIHYASQCKHLTVSGCLVDSLGMRLRKDIDYKLKKLDFYHTGVVSKWRRTPQKFTSILQAISLTKLRSSL